MIHLEGLARQTPELPAHGWSAAFARLSLSAALHVLAAAVAVSLFAHVGRLAHLEQAASTESELKTYAHLVFIAREAPPITGGGGGGGNRQRGPIRHAEGIGRDVITLRTTSTPASAPLFSDSPVDRTALPSVVLDARPLASGTTEVLGLPEGGVPFGVSTGSGSGGGVGDGSGTGIGSGTGPFRGVFFSSSS